MRRRSGGVFTALSAVAAFAAFAATCVITAPAASAGHSVWQNRRYPAADIGFLWMSDRKNYSGYLYVEHNSVGCGGVETNRSNEVWMNVQNSTRGQSYMSRWTQGVNHDNSGCLGTIAGSGMNVTFTYSSNYKDSAIGWDQTQANFLQTNGTYIGGRVKRTTGSSAYCAFWATSYPCGSRSWVHMNWTKWSQQSDAYKRRQILHEMGHAAGLIDCPSGYYGMMMDGSCGWDTTLIGWNADDRQSVSSIYP